jgi:hypothetical protein
MRTVAGRVSIGGKGAGGSYFLEAIRSQNESLDSHSFCSPSRRLQVSTLCIIRYILLRNKKLRWKPRGSYPEVCRSWFTQLLWPDPYTPRPGSFFMLAVPVIDLSSLFPGFNVLRCPGARRVRLFGVKKGRRNDPMHSVRSTATDVRIPWRPPIMP